MNKECLIKELKFFYSEYLYLKKVYHAYWHINSAMQQQDKAKNFLEVTRSTCIETFHMMLAKFYDEGKDAMSVYSLIEDCKKNCNLFIDSEDTFKYLTDVRREIKKCDAKNKIRFRRNKWLAHNDAKYFFNADESAEEDQYLPNYEIWQLIDRIGNLLKYILNQLGEKYEEDFSNDVVDIKDLLPDTEFTSSPLKF